MESRSKLFLTIGGIIAGSVLAFCCGLTLTVMVIIPAREGRDLFAGPTSSPTTVATPSLGVGPIARMTPVSPSPAPSYSVFTATPTPRRSTSSPAASATATPSQQPPPPPPPTPTPEFAFFYVEGSRVEELQCAHPYLQGWVRDADGNPLNGVTIQWQYWNNTEHAISGDPELVWQPGEFKFTYYAQDPSLETDFVLQVVESADDPVPLSEPLLIHYAGCATMGQITNIVFKHY
jgi:hypothetical protein